MLIYLWVVICNEYVHCNVHKLHTTTQAGPLWSEVPGSDCNWREDGEVKTRGRCGCCNSYFNAVGMHRGIRRGVEAGTAQLLLLHLN